VYREVTQLSYQQWFGHSHHIVRMDQSQLSQVTPQYTMHDAYDIKTTGQWEITTKKKKFLFPDFPFQGT
jgi:hypothetical protein